MKNENFITILGWMVNELKLQGNELLCYALIYGFSQDGSSAFNGSRKYIADLIGAKSLNTVDSVLKNLVDKKLIIKESNNINGVIFNSYKVIIEKTDFKNCAPHSNFEHPHSKIEHNNNSNIDSDKEKEIDKSISPKKNIDYDNVKQMWEQTNPNLQSFRGFNEKRKRALNTLLKNNNATIDDLYKAFEIIAVCDFCQGQNGRNWKATIDWILNDTNSCFNRLFEGVYAFSESERQRVQQIVNNERPTTQHISETIIINGQIYK